MLNQIVLVGRIVEIKEKDIKVAIPRSYKNLEGEYDTDFIPCVLWKEIAKNVIEYCQKGDLIGIKGRIQSRDNNVEVVAEKITFLSSK